jgi:phosphotransferase system HPr (HPr) family protein
MDVNANHLRICCPQGVEIREAFLLARVAQACRAEIKLLYDGYQADAKSMLSILHLGVCRRGLVTVVANGADAEAALAGVRALLDVPGPPVFVPELPPENDDVCLSTPERSAS